MQAVELIDGGENNPYHLFIYMLANFKLLDSSKPIYYYYPANRCKLAEEVLSLLPSNYIRHTEKQYGIRYIPFLQEYLPPMAKLNFVDSVLEDDYHFLRNTFKEYCKPRVIGKRLYISRNKDAKHNIVDNEEELIEFLKKLNFTILTMSELHARDQIGEISSVDILVAPHGAGMIYSVFCDPAATIIEIIPKGVKKARHYSHIAWALEIEFYKSWGFFTNEEKTHLKANIDDIKRYLLCHPKCIEDSKNIYRF